MQDLRGGCQGMPLELTGPFTGYNNGATMQVGLWIANDGEHIDFARRHAAQGPAYLRQVLTSLMLDAEAGMAPSLAMVFAEDGGLAAVDWAQIAFDLLLREPDEGDLRQARRELTAEMGYEDIPGDSEIWQRAYQSNRAAAEWLALLGVES